MSNTRGPPAPAPGQENSATAGKALELSLKLFDRKIGARWAQGKTEAWGQPPSPHPDQPCFGYLRPLPVKASSRSSASLARGGYGIPCREISLLRMPRALKCLEKLEASPTCGGSTVRAEIQEKLSTPA